MTTLPNDSVHLEGPAATLALNCHEYAIPWPPPERITHIGDTELAVPFVLIQRSVLTDEEAAADPTVARCALYLPIDLTIETGEPDA